MDFTEEISGKMSDNEEDSAEDRMMKVEALKKKITPILMVKILDFNCVRNF